VGLKPTRGRNPLGPHFGEVWGGLVVEHVLTRSVRDCAAFLDAICAPELGAPYEAPLPSDSFLAAVTTSPDQLRIGVTRARPQGEPFSVEAEAAVDRAAALCEELGHHVVEVNPAIDDGFDVAFVDLWAASNAWFVAYWTSIVGRTPQPDELEPLTWGLLERGRRQSAADHLLNLQYLAQVSRGFCTLWNEIDVWMCPTMSDPPALLGSDDPMVLLSEDFRFDNWRAVANVTGQPAITLPLDSTESGLPMGVQFQGRFGDEVTLFRLSGQLEQAAPWIERRPPL
jgi:amidase